MNLAIFCFNFRLNSTPQFTGDMVKTKKAYLLDECGLFIGMEIATSEELSCFDYLS
jgi:hypothetical protein